MRATPDSALVPASLTKKEQSQELDKRPSESSPSCRRLLLTGKFYVCGQIIMQNIDEPEFFEERKININLQYYDQMDKIEVKVD